MFVRTWVPVEVPQFFNPVTTLLEPSDTRLKWTGMKTVGQLRREQGVKRDPNPDSLYQVKRINLNNCLLSVDVIVLPSFCR